MPWLSTELVIDQLPEPSARALPIWVVPSNSATVAPASAVPVKVGVVALVMLSLFEVPESEPEARSGADGAAGTEVSIVTDSAAEATLVLPAASVALAVML